MRATHKQKVKMEKYRFAYSGDSFEGTKGFNLISDLRKFLKTVPEHELKNSVVIKNKGGIAYVGAFIRDKKMVVF